jgi:hypothetical protein
MRKEFSLATRRRAPVLYWTLCEMARLTAAPHSDHLTALLGQNRHIPILRAGHGISAAEQLMQCCGEPDMSIIMHPAIIISSVGSVDAVGGFLSRRLSVRHCA